MRRTRSAEARYICEMHWEKLPRNKYYLNNNLNINKLNLNQFTLALTVWAVS